MQPEQTLKNKFMEIDRIKDNVFVGMISTVSTDILF